jgi:hypothetical protein
MNKDYVMACVANLIAEKSCVSTEFSAGVWTLQACLKIKFSNFQNIT